jgi:peptidoglycan/LPS O-acetylase OafA/YrhL
MGTSVPMPERFDGGRLLLAVGAIVVLISLFVDWFEPDLTAWTVFEVEDLVLAAIAIGTLVAVLAEALPSVGLRPPAPWVLPTLGGAAVVLVVASLLNHPPAAVGRPPDTGAWIALAGSLAMALGALLGLGRVSVVITRRPRRAAAEPERSGSDPLEPQAPDVPAPRGSDPTPTRSLGFEELPEADPETRPLPEE